MWNSPQDGMESTNVGWKSCHAGIKHCTVEKNASMTKVYCAEQQFPRKDNNLQIVSNKSGCLTIHAVHPFITYQIPPSAKPTQLHDLALSTPPVWHMNDVRARIYSISQVSQHIPHSSVLQDITRPAVQRSTA